MNKLVGDAKARPYLLVEVAFTDKPYTDPADLAWTTVSRWATGITARRGKQYQLDAQQAGTSTVTLHDEASRFDPTNTAGPYYGKLDTGVPVRARLVHGAVIDGLCYGFADSFNRSWETNRSVMELGCVDALADFAGITPDPSWFSIVDPIGPYTWLRLGETPETFANTGASAGTGTIGTSYQIVRLAGPTLVTTDVAGLITSANGALRIYAPVTLGAGAGVFVGTLVGGTVRAGVDGLGGPTGLAASTATMFYRFDNQPLDGTHAWPAVGTRGPGGANVTFSATNGADIDTSQNFNISIRVDFNATTGNRYRLMANNGTTLYSATASVGPTTGQTDFLALANPFSNTWTLYVNGVVAATLTVTSLNVGPSLMLGLTGTTAAPFTHTIDEFAVFSFLTAGEVADLASRWPTAIDLPQQLTGDRVDALLDAIGWPAGLRDVDAGTVQLQAITDLSAKSIADHLQAAPDAELGALFVDGYGRVVFRDATHNTGEAITATFGEATGEYHYEGDVRVVRDRTRLVNIWEVTPDGGSPAVASDTPDRIRRNGHRRQSRTVPFANVADASAQAATLLSRTKDPHDRIDQVTLRGEANSANVLQIGTRELADLVKVNRRTPGGSTTSIPSTIQGLTATVTARPVQVAATFQLDPYPGTPVERYVAEVLTDAPLAYYRLGESAGTTVTDSSGHARHGTYQNAPTLGVPAAVFGTADTAVTCAAASSQAVYASTNAALLGNVNIVHELWIKNPDASGYMLSDIGSDFNWGLLCWEPASSKGWARISQTTYPFTYPTGVDPRDGNWHHYVMRAAAGTVAMFVDGVKVINDITRLTSSASANGWRLSEAGVLTPIQHKSGTYDEWAIYTSLTDARVAAHYAAGTT